MADNDWPAMVGNLQRERQKWEKLMRVMGIEGAYARTSGEIDLAVVQSLMLYRSETWVMNPHIGKVLVGFHHRVALRLTGKKPRQGRDGVWPSPPAEGRDGGGRPA